jgi:hypothetical protein
MVKVPLAAASHSGSRHHRSYSFSPDPEAAPARMPVSGGKKVSGVETAFALRKGTRASRKGCCATLTAEQDIEGPPQHYYSSTRCNRDKVGEMRATWHDFGVTIVAWHHAGFACSGPRRCAAVNRDGRSSVVLFNRWDSLRSQGLQAQLGCSRGFSQQRVRIIQTSIQFTF